MEQVSRSDRSYRKEQKKKNEDSEKQKRKKDTVSSGEFLSGFRKDDRLLPVIAPSVMSEEEIDLFQTSLREVILYIKYSKEKKKLAMFIENDAKLKAVNRKEAEVMNFELNIEEEEDTVNMCEAIRGMREDSERIGMQKGKLYSIEKMMKALKISAERAMEILEIPASDYPSYLSKLNRKEI